MKRRGEADVSGRDGVDFEEFFTSTKDQLLRGIIVVVRDRSRAEEAVAESFTRALEHWAEVAHHPAPAAWVAKTAFNYVRSAQRMDARTTDSDVPEVPRSDDPPTDPTLVRHLLALPRRQREVIALRVVLQLSTEETADVLGVAQGTVSAHLFRGLTRLEEELSVIAPKEAWR
jgi:RNA polymerase sigma factor (sigma-70 family)